jgi:hypothetical protein
MPRQVAVAIATPRRSDSFVYNDSAAAILLKDGLQSLQIDQLALPSLAFDGSERLDMRAEARTF